MDNAISENYWLAVDPTIPHCSVLYLSSIYINISLNRVPFFTNCYNNKISESAEGGGGGGGE